MQDATRPGGKPDNDVLDGVLSDFVDVANPNLLDRWLPMTDWLSRRLATGLDSSCKIHTSRIGPRITGQDRAGKRLSGVNLASQDYLGLSAHPHVVAAATDAALRFGVHSAGSAAQMGLTPQTVAVESRVAAFLGVADATVFPTGWGAGYAAIRALVRPGDHVLMDGLARPGLRDAALAATPNLHLHAHLSIDAVERGLLQLRQDHAGAGILLVTESLFSADSEFADLAALQALAWEFGATLLVDVAHDLGAIGPMGRGAIEQQGMLGRIDIVIGSFAKVFAANGGFVASSHPALKLALRVGGGSHAATNAISPMQAAAVLAAFDIVEGSEGAWRRARLAANSLHLRDGLSAEGFHPLGQPGALVPVMIGPHALARRMTAAVLAAGGIVNLVESPAIDPLACQWRLLVMSDHSAADIDAFVALAAAASAGWSSRHVMPGPGRVAPA